MAEVTSHAPGAFSWIELATTDQKEGVAFYRALFGWDVNDQPISNDEVYSMFQLGGKDVAAAYTLREDERSMGIPSHWNMYVTVVDADDAVKRAEELGAKTLVSPFDVMDAGRMGVLMDPAGAVFHVWQPHRHIGVRVLNEPGALCWSELTTRDTKASETFYTSLFGWTATHGTAAADMEYTEFSVQGTPSIGMMAMPAAMPAQVPSYWMPYFQVADCDGSVVTAQELGARVMVPAHDIPNTGRFAILNDPQGAMFAVFTFAGA